MAIVIVRRDKITREKLCFRHAVLRALAGKSIEEEVVGVPGVKKEFFADACVDCDKNEAKHG